MGMPQKGSRTRLKDEDAVVSLFVMRDASF